MDEPLHPAANPVPPPETPVDAGSQALSEALHSSFGIIKFVMVALVLLFFGSGLFKVGPDERAIKLRMGRVLGSGTEALLLPGLHWSLPYPIEEYMKVSVTGIKTVSSTIGWYATTPEQQLAGTEPPAGATLNPELDGYVLTADNNIVHIRATVNYRISDPVRYVFNFVNASNAIQNALDNALLHAASRYKVDDLLRSDVFGFQDAVRHHVTELVEKQDLGIVVEQCAVEESIPPRQLKDAFKSVLDAKLNGSKALNEALSYANQTTNRADGDATSLIKRARSDGVLLVTELESRADEFQKLLPQYTANPDLFIQKLLTETLGRVFTNAQDKIFVAQAAEGLPREVRLSLNRELPKPKTEAPKP
jgi:modulator of FtsH protease HflK